MSRSYRRAGFLHLSGTPRAFYFPKKPGHALSFCSNRSEAGLGSFLRIAFFAIQHPLGAVGTVWVPQRAWLVKSYKGGEVRPLPRPVLASERATSRPSIASRGTSACTIYLIESVQNFPSANRSDRHSPFSNLTDYYFDSVGNYGQE